MRGPYGANRLAAEISDAIVLGPAEKKNPQESLEFYNDSEYDLTVSLMDGEAVIECTLIYPLVIAGISRPFGNQVVRIEIDGIRVDLARDKFKRKMNYVRYGEKPDLSKSIRTYQMWYDHVLSMSDKIEVSEESTIFYYKSSKDSGCNAYLYYFVIILFYQILFVISLIILYYVYKRL